MAIAARGCAAILGGMKAALVLAAALAAMQPAAPAGAGELLPQLCLRGAPAPSLRLQRQDGTVACAEAPGGGEALLLRAGPKGARVGKAAVILPFAPLSRGRVTAEAQVFFPEGAPLNSVLLMDMECKRCGLPGNPGLRVYLRDGRLRIDRAKIGERHAWTNPEGPLLEPGRWHRITWELTLSEGEDGAARIWLDGALALEATGRTLPLGGRRAALDRVQIGLTANSNPEPVQIWLRDLRLDVQPAP